MDSDAADVGYGGTLGFNPLAGSPGLWEGRGFWTAPERMKSISLREFRTVMLLLHRFFSGYVSHPNIRTLLVHEDNQGVLSIFNAMVLSIPAMISELKKLRKFLQALEVRKEARWLPSAVNRFADALSRTWRPGDIRVSRRLLRSICRQYDFDLPAFQLRPMNEPLPARLKVVQEQLSKGWGNGRFMLWNPRSTSFQSSSRRSNSTMHRVSSSPLIGLYNPGQCA